MFGLLPTQPTVPAPAGPKPLELQVQDTLASARRLWIRGRLKGMVVPVPEPAGGGWWWSRQAKGPTEPVPPPTIHIETTVSGQVLETDLPLGLDGEFDATFSVHLTPSRRGWRVARNHVTFQGQTTDRCGLVLTPSAESRGVVAVLLPRGETLQADGPRRLENSELARSQASLLQRLNLSGRTLYYFACVPALEEGLQTQLGLAAAALGWPSGHFILITPGANGTEAAVAAGVDRLRWLFAEGLDFQLVNLDPQFTHLEALAAANPDRAAVSRVIDSSTALNAAAAQPHGKCHAAPHRLRSGLVTRYPIVFCHGMLACSMLRMQLPKEYNYFSIMRGFLKERGFRALYPMVIPTGGVAERARQLAEQIRSWTDEPVNIIAHSMGGLDARYLISCLGLADQVKSLTTVATPHRGTPLADWFLENYSKRVPFLLALEAVGINVSGFGDCRPSVCRDLNARAPNMPGVRYFSYVGDVPGTLVTPMLRRTWNMLYLQEGPNDGLVSVESARWGDYLGTIRADHFAQTPDGLFVRDNENFDSLAFFTRLVEDLARRGF